MRGGPPDHPASARSARKRRHHPALSCERHFRAQAKAIRSCGAKSTPTGRECCWRGMGPRLKCSRRILAASPASFAGQGTLAPIYRHLRRRHSRDGEAFLLADVHVDERISKRIPAKAFSTKTALRLIADVRGLADRCREADVDDRNCRCRNRDAARHLAECAGCLRSARCSRPERGCGSPHRRDLSRRCREA